MGPVVALTKRSMVPYPMVVLKADDQGGNYETRVSQFYISTEVLDAYKDRIEIQLDLGSDIFKDLFAAPELKAQLDGMGTNLIMTVPITKATSDKPILRYYRARKRSWQPRSAIVVQIDEPIQVVSNGVYLEKVCDVCDRKGACSSEFEQTAKLRCIKNGAFARELVVEEQEEEEVAQ